MTPRTVIDTIVHIFVALIYDVIAQSTMMVSDRFCMEWYICPQYSICGRHIYINSQYLDISIQMKYICFICMSYFANFLFWLWAILNLVLVISTLACLVSRGEGIIITRSNESWWFSNFQTNFCFLLFIFHKLMIDRYPNKYTKYINASPTIRGSLYCSF